mmetsp:Transcript_8642/g.27878  ORF Transcript_8642/g.27878 Transcript_8642/m.27878 type:complete len:206 (-) Transcript_8642:151-768(-)
MDKDVSERAVTRGADRGQIGTSRAARVAQATWRGAALARGQRRRARPPSDDFGDEQPKAASTELVATVGCLAQRIVVAIFRAGLAVMLRLEADEHCQVGALAGDANHVRCPAVRLNHILEHVIPVCVILCHDAPALGHHERVLRLCLLVVGVGNRGVVVGQHSVRGTPVDHAKPPRSAVGGATVCGVRKRHQQHVLARHILQQRL